VARAQGIEMRRARRRTARRTRDEATGKPVVDPRAPAPLRPASGQESAESPTVERSHRPSVDESPQRRPGRLRGVSPAWRRSVSGRSWRSGRRKTLFSLEAIDTGGGGPSAHAPATTARADLISPVIGSCVGWWLAGSECRGEWATKGRGHSENKRPKKLGTRAEGKCKPPVDSARIRGRS